MFLSKFFGLFVDVVVFSSNSDSADKIFLVCVASFLILCLIGMFFYFRKS